MSSTPIPTPIPNDLPTPSRYITTHDPSSGASIISTAIPAPAKWQHLKGAHASFFLAYCTDTFPVDLSTPVSIPEPEPLHQDHNTTADIITTTDNNNITASTDTTDITTSTHTPANPTHPPLHLPLALPIDISAYQNYLTTPPGLTLSTGTVLRYVDMAPAHTSPMHRTASLDYGVVLEGAVELVLDGGETRLLRRGDVAVQRATAHAWRNPSATRWARMLFVLVACRAGGGGGGEDGQAGGVGMVGTEDLGGMEGVRGSD